MRKRATELNELEEGDHVLYAQNGFDQSYKHGSGHKPSKQVLCYLFTLPFSSLGVLLSRTHGVSCHRCSQSASCDALHDTRSLCGVKSSKQQVPLPITMSLVMQDRTLWQDTPNMLVLVLLYMMQGVPLGLTMGAM